MNAFRRGSRSDPEGELMRLYLKLALMILVMAVVQWSLQSTSAAAWETRFAARCWVAHYLRDERLNGQLVQEARLRLREDLDLAIAADLPLGTVHASSAGPAVAKPAATLTPNCEWSEWKLSFGHSNRTQTVNRPAGRLSALPAWLIDPIAD
jgi:hypothetical protein